MRVVVIYRIFLLDLGCFVYIEYSMQLAVTFLVFLTAVGVHCDNGVRYLEFRYSSEVVSRYGRTAITSVIRNDALVSKEQNFYLTLPDTAFVSNFSMTIGSRSFYGIAKKKQQALDEFRNRSESGENVGLVQQLRDGRFLIRMNTAAGSEASFTLEYEELVRREQSKYRKRLDISPGAVVDSLSASIRIKESEGFTSYTTSDFATIQKISDNEIACNYIPTLEAQQQLGTNGLSIVMECVYDVVHPTEGAGNFAVSDGYFAQFFLPVISSSLRINLVLVIDVSGSMSGRKIEQAKESLVALLDQLHNDDYVAMVSFESSTSLWRSNLVRVHTHREDARSFARGLHANGGTALNNGLQDGIALLKRSTQQSYANLLVLLTDGQPTSGVTNSQSIISAAIESTRGTDISLNCIGFGAGADMQLLRDIALSNYGVAKMIAESSNAREELIGFLQEIATPILADVEIVFPAGTVEEATDLAFPFLFSGSELVVAGRFSQSSPETITVQVTGSTADSLVTYSSMVSTVTETAISNSVPSTERLRAYLKIKDLLNQKRLLEISGGSDEDIAVITAVALELALEYNFVTQLTSLIVVEEGNELPPGSEDYDDQLEDFDIYTLGRPPTSDVAAAGGGCYKPSHYSVVAMVASLAMMTLLCVLI